MGDLNVLDPNWIEGDRTEDWRFYIGENTRRWWSSFTEEQKRVLAMDAHNLAHEETGPVVAVNSDAAAIPELGAVAAWSFIAAMLSPLAAVAGAIAWIAAKLFTT